MQSGQRETSDFIKPDEVATATEIILRQEQYKFYSEEITTLKTKTQVKPSSKILKLYPFLDNEILCVGGRCANADFSDEAKYPRIVPQKSELARLIILDAHHSTLHGGTTQTIAEIRSHFWIPACRNQVRKLIMNCVTCSRFNGKPEHPLMGDLPKKRVTIPSKVFKDVGLDFGGPFLCKEKDKEFRKVYMALFDCFASKAVHLEVVSDLTTQACIAALRRFTSRRGCPVAIYSDNATNFTESQAELAKLQEILNQTHSDSLQSAAAGQLIKWKFIPRAPHFGGL